MPSAGQPTSVRMEPTLYDGLRSFVKTQNKRGKRTTIKAQLEAAVRTHLAAEQSEAEASVIAPAIEQIIDARVERLERRMASIMAKSGLDAATALYVLLYTLAETNKLMRAVRHENEADLPLIDVQEWYQRARSRAIKHFREKDPLILQALADG